MVVLKKHGQVNYDLAFSLLRLKTVPVKLPWEEVASRMRPN
jgi:hypothetical protein